MNEKQRENTVAELKRVLHARSKDLRDGNEELEDAVAGLLADVMVLCEEEGIDFDDAVDAAYDKTADDEDESDDESDEDSEGHESLDEDDDAV